MQSLSTTRLAYFSSKALISSLNLAEQEKILVVCRSARQARELERQLRFFLAEHLSTKPEQTQNQPQIKEDDILLFPNNEVLLYDSFSPDAYVTSERISAIYKLLSGEGVPRLSIIDLETLLHFMAPKSYFIDRGIQIKQGQKLELTQFTQNLTDTSYTRRSYVAQPGDMAVRGAIVDIFPPDSQLAYRLEWFDDDIASIRTFDLENQLSIEKLDKISILPSSEFPLDEEGRGRFLRAWQDSFLGSARRHPIYLDMQEGKNPAGVESFIPLFFREEMACFLDYLTNDKNSNGLDADVKQSIKLIYDDEIYKQADAILMNADSRWQELGGDDAVLLPPNKLLITDIKSRLQEYHRLNLPLYKADTKAKSQALTNQMQIQDLSIDMTIHDKSKRLAKLISFHHENKMSVLLCIEAKKRLSLVGNWFRAAKEDYLELETWQEFSKLTSTESSAETSNKASDKKSDKKSAKPIIAMINFGVQDSMIYEDGTQRWAIISETDLFSTSSSKVSDTADDTASSALNLSDHPTTNLHSLRHKVYNATDPNDNSRLDRVFGRASITPGELVIHADYGLGRFVGLEVREHDGVSGEFVVIEYAEESKLYLPIHNIHLLTSYSSVVGTGVDYPLDKLSSKWSRRKAQSLRKIEDTAVKLLQVYAEREQQQAIEFSPPDEDYEEFTLGFPFEETKDQAAAIEDVIKDMCSTKKMDRIICGDVGFGKTEIAIRAAYLAASSGYQVAILTPTTLLASQHFELFKQRFANVPVNIGIMTRLIEKHSQIREQLRSGSLDIIIGTHGLLGEKINFKQLGLVIIDEEHRFGVRQKEKIKRLHKNIDILSLSATPIPRTLNMALSGLRDISLLSSPPPGRLPIKTYTGVYAEGMVKEAISRELTRDGQVYYLYNDIESMPQQLEELNKIFPDVSIAMVHGKSEKMEEIMTDFYHNKISIILCTTVIENGLDIPNANTMIVADAEHFGLSQMHQLRGRVGRSNRQAYAYFFLSRDISKDDNASKRIDALKRHADLGIGFNLATYDLELRGAGEILGTEQSGFVQRMGLELYTSLLSDAVASMRDERGDEMNNEISDTNNGKNPSLKRIRTRIKTEIEIALSAFLPSDYVPDVLERMHIYKQMDQHSPDLEKIKRDLNDLYGNMPLFAANLFEMHKVRLKAQHFGITKIRIARLQGLMQVDSSYSRTISACESLARDEPHNYLFRQATLRFKCDELGGLQQMIRLNNLMRSLQSVLPAT